MCFQTVAGQKATWHGAEGLYDYRGRCQMLSTDVRSTCNITVWHAPNKG
jgi:hypothetical protein